jgi:hypothetical protein
MSMSSTPRVSVRAHARTRIRNQHIIIINFGARAEESAGTCLLHLSLGYPMVLLYLYTIVDKLTIAISSRRRPPAPRSNNILTRRD